MSTKYKILEKLNYIEFYQKRQIEAIRRKWFILMIIGFCTLIICALSYFDFLTVVENKPKNFTLTLFVCGSSPIIVAIWILTKKRYPFFSKDIESLSTTALKKYLKELGEFEEKLLDMGARKQASAVAMLITMLIGFGLPAIIWYYKTGVIKFFDGQLSREHLISMSLLVIYIATFEFATIISLPMSPRKYFKEKEKLNNRITFSFLTNIDDSIINPLFNK